MPEDNDQNLNPGQSDYNRKFDFDPSKKDTNENSDTDRNYSDNISDTANNLKNAEENPNSEWQNNYTGGTQPKSSKINLKNFNKKGPIAAIITLIFGGGFAITTLLSPSLLLLQVKEALTNAFNYQNTSMNVRTTKLLTSKMKTTSGVCTSKLSVKCKYSSMSEKQIANFKKAGITVVADVDASKTLTGRTIVKEIEFNGKTITPNLLSSEISSNPELRNALYKAYNPKYAGFSDSLAKTAFRKLGISKAKVTTDGNTFEEKFENLDKQITEGNKLEKIEKTNYKEGDTDPFSGEKITSAKDANTLNDQIKNYNELIDIAGQDGEGVSAKVINGATGAYKAIKITSFADDSCSVYRTTRAVGYAAKTIRVAQLAAYAVLFLNIADQIKAGDANPDDVSFFGTILTNTSADDDGNQLSATDSYGYKYAAYNDIGNTSTSMMRYMAAAGATGLIVNLFQALPSPVNKTCNTLGNPAVGFVSFLIGGAVAILSGGVSVEASLSVKAVKAAALTSAKGALTSKSFWTSPGVALSFAEVFLPSLLGDIVAGNIVDSDTVGANAGDAITSGSSGIMGTLAKTGGNAPLTVDQAVDYSNLSKKISSQESIAVNQFDISDNNSFAGKFASSMIPYVSKFSSLTGIINSISSMNSRSISGLISTKTFATNEAEQYSQCTDTEYRNLNLATDPFCNVMYGIPSDAIEIDPNIVNDELLNVAYIDATTNETIKKPQINEETGDPINQYTDFVSECINRTTPIGTLDSEDNNGSNCIFGASWNIGSTSINNKYYYLHYIDQRINKGMDGEDSTLEAALNSEYNTNLSFYDSTENNNSSSNNMIADIFKFFNLGWSN